MVNRRVLRNRKGREMRYLITSLMSILLIGYIGGRIIPNCPRAGSWVNRICWLSTIWNAKMRGLNAPASRSPNVRNPLALSLSINNLHVWGQESVNGSPDLIRATRYWERTMCSPAFSVCSFEKTTLVSSQSTSTSRISSWPLLMIEKSVA